MQKQLTDDNYKGINKLIFPAISGPFTLLSVFGLFYIFGTIDFNFGLGIGIIFLYMILHVVFICRTDMSWAIYFASTTIVIGILSLIVYLRY